MTTSRHRNPGGTDVCTGAAALTPQPRPGIDARRTAAIRRNRTLPRAAIFGRVNASPTDGRAHVAIARQFRACQDFRTGRATITQFFYDFNQPTDQAVAHHVREYAGSPKRHGGWPELADLLPCLRRDIDLVVCLRLDLIGRRSVLLAGRGASLRRHGMRLVTAAAGWEDPTSAAIGWHLLASPGAGGLDVEESRDSATAEGNGHG